MLRPPVQPRHRRRRAGRLQVRPRERLRLHGPGRRRRPARPGRDPQAGRRRWRTTRRSTWSAGRASSPTPATSRPISRRTGIHLFAFLLSRICGQPVTDPTSGFRLYNRRAIALFARDYPHDYPEVEAVLMLHHHRLRMREVPVRMFQRGGGVSSISSGKSRLLHDQGAARALRRPGPRPSGAGAGRRGARRRGRTGSDGASGSRSSRSSPRVALLLLVLEMVRRRRFMERYALLWLLSAVVILGLAVWQGAAVRARQRDRDHLPAERAVLRRVRLRPAAAAALLARRVAAGRPDEGPRPAAGAAGEAHARLGGDRRGRRRPQRRRALARLRTKLRSSGRITKP